MKTKLALNSQVHPQEIAIPETLEIHPSIPADLANEMMRVASLFTKHPKTYNGTKGVLSGDCGCIMAHVTGATYENSHASEDFSCGVASARWPQFSRTFRDIYANSYSEDKAAWAIARIEHFLKTGA